MIEIRPDDLSGEATRGLLADHLRGMQAHSPPGSVYALDLSGLLDPSVSVWSAWIDGEIAGVGALKQLDARAGEIKSMRTSAAYVRKGVATALIEHIIIEARARGFERLSLETGSGTGFEPALALYRKRGFVNGESFGAYTPSAFNQFLHIRL